MTNISQEEAEEIQRKVMRRVIVRNPEILDELSFGEIENLRD